MTEIPLGASHVPLGPGLVAISLSLPRDRVVLLRGILAGYDGLVSAHGDDSGSIALVTTTEQEAELRALLAELSTELALDVDAP